MAKRRTRADQERIRQEVQELAKKPPGEPMAPSGIGFAKKPDEVLQEQNICSATCPHCGAVLTFPGFEVIYAFVCRECGEGVDLKPKEQ